MPSYANQTGALTSKYIPYNLDPIRTNTLQQWMDEHPSWVMYQADKATPAYDTFGDPNVPLDITNPDVILWQVETFAKPAAQSHR